MNIFQKYNSFDDILWKKNHVYIVHTYLCTLKILAKSNVWSWIFAKSGHSGSTKLQCSNHKKKFEESSSTFA